jgi:hypothetical protein
MKRILAILILTTGSVAAQSSYYSLVKGNELKTWCKTWDKVIRVNADHTVEHDTDATPTDIYDAAMCAGYVEGIVDSLPADDSFAPGENVRGSQHIAVVENFLNAHPELLDQPAMKLARRALREAFGTKANSK